MTPLQLPFYSRVLADDYPKILRRLYFDVLWEISHEIKLDRDPIMHKDLIANYIKEAYGLERS